jgi:hypothetical protein
MFAQEPPPDFDVPGRREPGEGPELVAEVGLVEVACATGEVTPVDRSGEVQAGGLRGPRSGSDGRSTPARSPARGSGRREMAPMPSATAGC